MSRDLPDPRLHAYRPGLAAEALRGIIEADRYVKGEKRQVTVSVLPLRREPRFDAMLDSEALLGETLTLYDENEGWAWVQLDRDAYVGYMPSEGLSRKIVTPTHRVAALRSYIHPEPDPKSPPLGLLSLNARVAAMGEPGRFVPIAGGGFVYARHVVPATEPAPDFVAVAESFLGTPYLWGGRTSIGLDCSGLVQLALEAAGLPAPRDADMQAAMLGEEVDWRGGAALGRGDLVFWPGHVGIMTSATGFIHANAHHMTVERETLAEAIERTKQATGDEVICVRRL